MSMCVHYIERTFHSFFVSSHSKFSCTKLFQDGVSINLLQDSMYLEKRP